MNWYTELWAHNTTAAVLAHGVALIIIAMAIDGLTYERRLFNLRTKSEDRQHPEDEVFQTRELRRRR